MKRQGIHRPTIEDIIELSGIETLHPGGMALTRRTAEVAGLKTGMKVLDVSSGHGTQAIFYAQEYGVQVTGVDISPEMLAAARHNASQAGVEDRVAFIPGDSQDLPLPDDSFDAVINECAVGIPDDSQAVLNQMVRVARPGGAIVIHESTWRAALGQPEKDKLSERYGTTPLEHDQWVAMLEAAGVVLIKSECEPWSRPEMFWKIRRDREVDNPNQVMTATERARTVARLLWRFGPAGVKKALENQKEFYKVVMSGRLGYCLYWGQRSAA